MKVLLVSQSQDGSYANLISQAVKAAGGTLSIITGKYRDIDKDVTVIPAKQYNSTSVKNRFQTWFAYVNDVKGYLKQHIDEYDLIMFTSNPPVNQSLVKYALKKKKKCVYLVWDIYPNTIEKMFGKKVAPITSVWRRKNHAIYQKCDAVMTIGDVMKGVLEKDYPDVTFKVIPYHADTEFIRPIPRTENEFVFEYQLADKKVFMYSGKMGAGHGFDDILQAAETLKCRDDIRFLLIGHGSSFESVQANVKKRALKNVLVLPYQPLERLPYTLSSADVSFITIKEDTDGLFLPSKVYDAMASESAVLCISGPNNDVVDMIEKEHLGMYVKPGNAEELTKAILRFADDEAFLRTCQKRAREIAVERYAVAKVTEAYAALFAEVMQHTSND